MWKSLYEATASFAGRRKIVLYWELFILLICYGFKLFNFSLTLDNDLDVILAAGKPYSNIDFFFNGNGRYIAGLVRRVFTVNGSFVPYVSALMGVVFLGLSSLLMCVLAEKLLNRPIPNSAFVAFLSIFQSVPFLYSQHFAFDSTVDLVYFFTLIQTIGLYGLTVPGVRRSGRILSGVLVAICFSAFQHLVVTYLAMFFFVAFLAAVGHKDMTLRQLWSFCMPCIIAGCIALLCYVAVLQVGSILAGSPSDYVQGYIGWSTDGIRTGLMHIRQAVARIFLWTNPYGAAGCALSLVMFLAVLVRLLLQKGIRTAYRLMLCALFMGFFMSLFALCIALGSLMPYRTYTGVPFFVGAAWLLALTIFERPKPVRFALLTLCTLLASHQMLLLNTYIYSTYQTAELEKTYALEIAHDILRANDGVPPRQPVMFVGNYRVDTPQSVRFEGVGSTMLSWYEPMRKYNLLSAYGYRFNDSLKDSEQAQIQASSIAATMPNWPSENSIAITNDMVVVKLSGYRLEKWQGDWQSYSQKYTSASAESNQYINEAIVRDSTLSLYGWAYLQQADSIHTKMSILLVGHRTVYQLVFEPGPRQDVDAAFNPTSDGRYSRSGIQITVTSDGLGQDIYDVYLLMENENAQKISLVDLGIRFDVQQ